MGSINPHSPSRKQPDSSSPQPSNSTRKHIHHQYVLQFQDRQIILDYKNKLKLTIADIVSFPSGFEGLHLWDSHVILSRFIISNLQIWNKKYVLQLLSGTGIASISLRKYSTASKILSTDPNQQVLQNISRNMQKNNLPSQSITLSCIPTWTSAHLLNYKEQFDYIIGADLLFKGCPVELLIQAFATILKIGGKGYIVVPYQQQKKGMAQQDSTIEFMQKLDTSVFSFKKQKLIDQIYMESPLLNQVLGYEQFPQISQGIFYLYTIEKIKQKSNTNEMKIPLEIERPVPKIQKMKKEEELIKQQQIQIKQQDEKQHKVELQVVKISKSEDKPEYERKKRKTIDEIIADSEKNNTQKLEEQKQKQNQGCQANGQSPV